MEFLYYPLALIIMLGVLITFHELGHFLVARWSGVRVVRFSVGFGKPLWSRVDKHGTEFAIAAIPFGGYVRMLGEHEPGEVSMAVPRRPGDITHGELSAWWRLAISFAGPAANFLLAVIIYWVVFVMGTTAYAPVVGQIEADSPVGQAGLLRYAEIEYVDGVRTQNWSQLNLALAERMGDSGEIVFEAHQPGLPNQRFSVAIDAWHQGAKDPDLFGSLGITMAVPALVGEVLSGGAGDRYGLRAWDLIVSADGAEIDGWGEWVEKVQASPDERIVVGVLRAGEHHEINVTPDAVDDGEGGTIGLIGVKHHRHVERYGPLAAIPRSVAETWNKTLFTFGILKKMVTGQVSVENLSSPIMIAKVAGDLIQVGLNYFLKLAALLSISLGVLNLLPVPVLDGGHIMFCLAELIRGKPVSEKIQMIGVQIGLFLVVGIAIIAVYNDLTRLL